MMISALIMRVTRIVIIAVLLYSPANAAPSRISSGQDLYNACKVLSDFALNREGPTPRQGLYCRRFLSGYFTSLKYMNGMAGTDSVQGVPVYTKDCIALTGPHSYDQLAADIVRHGEWHPELMGRPAMELVKVTFGGRPPC